jgi:hypothetical protein
MQIEEPKKEQTYVKYLDVGDLFKFRDRLFMRTNIASGGGHDHHAIDLSDGSMQIFNDDALCDNVTYKYKIVRIGD